MASADTVNTKIPVLVIKRGNLFKLNSTLLYKTRIKRPITDVSVQSDAPHSKRQCVPDDVRSTEVFIKNQTEIPTADNSSNASDQLTKNACLNVSTENKIKVPKKRKTYTRKKLNTTKCQKHDELPEHQAEGLVQVGDTFTSIEKFMEYTTGHAQQWFFYYTLAQTHNRVTADNYDFNKYSTWTYTCRFNRHNYKSKGKGMRKHKEKLGESCPAALLIRREAEEKELKVIDVCHHHSHELSAEIFRRLPHGYRLSQEMKEEIRDLATFNMHPLLVRRYFESKLPGLKINKTIWNEFNKAKRTHSIEVMSPERTKEMLEKIRYIKANFNLSVKRSTNAQSGTKLKKGKKAKKSSKKDFLIKYDEELDLSDTELQQPACEAKLNPWEEERSNDVDSVRTDVEYNIKDKFSIEMNDATGNDKASYSIPDKNITIDEQEETFHSHEQMPLVNPATGFIDELKLLANTTTDLYDKRQLKPVPNAVESDEHTESTNKFKSYKIGDITIESIETVDSSGIATVALNTIKAKKGLTERNLLNELSAVETSINKPRWEYFKKINGTGPNEANLLVKKGPAVTPVELRCQNRHGELPEYQAEDLIKIGDTFFSMEEFARHAAAHASKWFFYYYIHDSRNVKTSYKYNSNKTTWYNFGCRFNKGGYRSKSTGARKIRQKTIQCPAAVAMRCEPGENRFTVTYVCHHHSHELSAEIFSQQAHGHRLPSEFKDEIRELAWYQLDLKLIRLYLQVKTGFDLKQTIKNVVNKMKKNKQKINVTPEEEQEILDKIEGIKQKFTIPKRVPPESKNKNQTKEKETNDLSGSEGEGNASRVEARLNNILYDRELIESVKELQESTGCEIEIKPWGEVNVIDNGIANLQSGLKEDTESSVQHAYKDIADSQVEIDQEVYGQVEIDQEVYTMDDTIQYIIPSNHDGTNIFGVDNIAAECGENVVYIPQVYPYNNETTLSGVDNTAECSETANEKTFIEYETNIHGVDNTTQWHAENVENEVECIDDGTNEVDNTQSEENIHEEKTELSKYYHEAAFEYSCDENEYQTMYTNDEDCGVENESEHVHFAQCVNETYTVRDIGVQADLEIINLESDFDKIQKLETAITNQDLEKSGHSFSTRGRPKFVLEEGIINRFNIEFYISVGSISKCLENLAIGMNLSVLDLLKQLYQGEAVFKMVIGRSGTQNRKTVHLTYIPLTITLPFEKFKYMNYLQEYKTMCSKYEDLVMKLEKSVQITSADLNAMSTKLENAESQNHKLSETLENYENLLKPHALTEQLLKKSQEDLKEAQAQIEVMSKKIKSLEDLDTSSRRTDAEILKQLLEPTFERHRSNKVKIENKFLRERITELEETSPVNIRLTERIKILEQTLEVANADAQLYKNRIRKLEELYLTDSQSLLDKIKVLEEELAPLRSELSYMKKTENPPSYILRYTESENKRLRKEIEDLEELRTFNNKKLVEKIKRLDAARCGLEKRLEESKQKNYRVISKKKK